MADVTDVVVVGGGIAGASLGYALADAGLGVTVLEASTEFQDRVRGESMQAWGFREARELGVEDILLAAGAHIATVWKQYVEGIGEAGQIPMSVMVDGIPGTLNLRHPVACQALLDAAASAGASVVRGTSDVRLSGGGSPTVTFHTADGDHEVKARLVVGADGRGSTVRKQAGITLERQAPMNHIAGLLVEGLDDVPDDHDVLAGEGDLFFTLFHQGDGRARAYLMTGASGRQRFTGPERVDTFLSACAMSCYPWSEQVANAQPAGPVATYAGDDTWTATPYADGVVLIGDAAGYNDPIIGQGLSIALRDARMVRDLVLDGASAGSDFAPYGDERVGRMERLRFIADIVAVSQAEDADNRPARRAFFGERMATMDPEFMSVLIGSFAGPETVPDDALNPDLLDRIRSA